MLIFGLKKENKIIKKNVLFNEKETKIFIDHCSSFEEIMVILSLDKNPISFYSKINTSFEIIFEKSTSKKNFSAEFNKLYENLNIINIKDNIKKLHSLHDYIFEKQKSKNKYIIHFFFVF